MKPLFQHSSPFELFSSSKVSKNQRWVKSPIISPNLESKPAISRHGSVHADLKENTRGSKKARQADNTPVSKKQGQIRVQTGNGPQKIDPNCDFSPATQKLFAGKKTRKYHLLSALIPEMEGFSRFFPYSFGDDPLKPLDNPPHPSLDCAPSLTSRPITSPDRKSFLGGRGSCTGYLATHESSFRKHKVEVENTFSKTAFENALLRSGFEQVSRWLPEISS